MSPLPPKSPALEPIKEEGEDGDGDGEEGFASIRGSVYSKKSRKSTKKRKRAPVEDPEPK